MPFRRRPLLATAVVVGASRSAARNETQKQQAQQEAQLNTQARLQWEAEQSTARDQKIADDAAKAALASQGQGQGQGYPQQQQAPQYAEGQRNPSQPSHGNGKPKFCSGCGHRLADGARFCEECGSQVQG